MTPHLKSWLVAALIFCSVGLPTRLALSAEVAVSGGFPRKLGDLDGDGRATVLDIVRLANHLNGTAPLSADLLLFADVNQDGVVDNRDVTAIANAVLGWPHYPNCPTATAVAFRMPGKFYSDLIRINPTPMANASWIARK